MVASSDEAILLFDKWLIEGTTLICFTVSDGWKGSFKGKLTSRDGNTFTLSWPNSGTGVLIVSLDVVGIAFAYADSSEISSLGKDGSGLVVEMPSSDRLTFIELSIDGSV